MKNFFYLFIFFYGSCFGQQKDCNRTVYYKNLSHKIPDQFCMPEGYQIFFVIDTVDLTDDGLSDKIIEWEKPTPSEGDTSFISIYKQNPDKSYTFCRTLGNLFTPYFWTNDPEYPSSNPKLQKVKKYYVYPNYNLVKFFKNTIKVGIYLETGGTADLNFVYDKKTRNWVLRQELFFSQDQQLEKEQKPEVDTKVTDFDIFKFLENL